MYGAALCQIAPLFIDGRSCRDRRPMPAEAIFVTADNEAVHMARVTYLTGAVASETGICG